MMIQNLSLLNRPPMLSALAAALVRDFMYKYDVFLNLNCSYNPRFPGYAYSSFIYCMKITSEVTQKVARAHTVTPGPIIHLYKENDGTLIL